MAEQMFITGQIQNEPHEVVCDAMGLSGSPPVQSWIRAVLGDTYRYPDLKKHLQALSRLFDRPPEVFTYGDATSQAPPPHLDRIEPESLSIGNAPDTTVHVYGSGFCPRSRLLLNGVAETTAFVSTRQLSTTLTGAAMAPGSYSVEVENAEPGGGVSTGRTFYVLDGTKPTVTRRGPTGECWQVPA